MERTKLTIQTTIKRHRISMNRAILHTYHKHITTSQDQWDGFCLDICRETTGKNTLTQGNVLHQQKKKFLPIQKFTETMVICKIKQVTAIPPGLQQIQLHLDKRVTSHITLLNYKRDILTIYSLSSFLQANFSLKPLMQPPFTRFLFKTGKGSEDN